jgi:hypothetical protein
MLNSLRWLGLTLYAEIACATKPVQFDLNWKARKSAWIAVGEIVSIQPTGCTDSLGFPSSKIIFRTERSIKEQAPAMTLRRAMNHFEILIALALTVFAQGCHAKVPMITVEATCNQAAIMAVRVESVAEEFHNGAAISKAVATVEKVMRGNVSNETVFLYFQPKVSVSAFFAPGKSYVVFAQPFKAGFVAVNGYAGVVEINDGQVDDSLFLDGRGNVSLIAFASRIAACRLADVNAPRR